MVTNVAAMTSKANDQADHAKRGTCLQVANIVANNASLVLISLSLNQIIRSGIPIVTAILGVVIEHTVR